MRKPFRVPFGTLTVTNAAKRLLQEALGAGRLTGGRLVRRFEERFAELLGVADAVAVSSGTDAVALALAVLYDFGARRGDEVIVPALSFVATGNAVLQAGFTPTFVDIDRATLNMAPDRIESTITEKTRAILPVHLMGKPAPMDAIDSLAQKHGLCVIEDAAEAYGATYNGKPAGALADMGAFSLYAAHIVSAVEGGIVATNNPEYAAVLRSLRAHGRACACPECRLNTGTGPCRNRFNGPGQDTRFRFDRIGYSSKMNELEAAVGLGNLDVYRRIVRKRRANFVRLADRFDDFAPYLATLHELPNERIGPHAFPIVIQEEAGFTRAELTAHLEDNGIETRSLFSSMPTQCPGFVFLGHIPGQFPNAEYIGDCGLHIGIHQDLGPGDMDYVADMIQRFLDGHRRP